MKEKMVKKVIEVPYYLNENSIIMMCYNQTDYIPHSPRVKLDKYLVTIKVKRIGE